MAASAGVFTALTGTEAWTVPMHRMLCVPDGVEVQIDTPGRVAIRCLYVDPELDLVGGTIRLVGLSPLMRELLMYAVDRAPTDLSDGADVATLTLLRHLVDAQPPVALYLPLPTDAEARTLADAIRRDPSTSIEEHLRHSAAGRRTLERRFADETRLSLGRWRRRARILAGVSMLADGATVTHTAVTVGYSSPSAFVQAFRSELGTPPRSFIRRR